ncbi:MAG TPA: divalent-cation tolerance protein CutA [bacterium]|nr:divalent-cation tolerance protein CutA [bacterium]
MSVYWVYVTTSSPEEARTIGKALVEARLAACANVVDPIHSFYWWEGRVQEGRECALILKTKPDLMEALTATVKAMHSYTCPCVVALPVEAGNTDFLAWVEQETR